MITWRVCWLNIRLDLPRWALLKEQTMPKIALLIDAENANASDIDQVISTLTKQGQFAHCLIFGDWQNTALSSWDNAILKHALKQCQQNSYVKGKNSTDIALVIAAMELLYTEGIDEFAIMSSDSDFTPLVQKLRQMGKTVWGFVGNNASLAFQQACNHCVTLSHSTPKKINAPQPIKTASKQNTPNSITKQKTTDQKTIEQMVINLIKALIAEGKGNGGWVSSSIIGTKLSEKNIKAKDLGYTNLQKLLESLPNITSKFCNKKNNYFYACKDMANKNNNDRKTALNNNTALIEKIKTAFYKQSKNGEYILVSNIAGVLGNNEYRLKSNTYGYATWTKLFDDLACFEVKKQGNHPMIRLKVSITTNNKKLASTNSVNTNSEQPQYNINRNANMACSEINIIDVCYNRLRQENKSTRWVSLKRLINFLTNEQDQIDWYKIINSQPAYYTILNNKYIKKK